MIPMHQVVFRRLTSGLLLLAVVAASGIAQASTLTIVQTRGGTVTKSVPDSAFYTPGSIITLNATLPTAGSTFLNWEGDTSGSTNPLPLALNKNKVDRTIAARFSTTTLVTATTKGLGTLAKVPNQPYYAPGSLVTITATPSGGSTFLGWSGDTTGSANPLVIRVTPGDMYLLAEFAPAVPAAGETGLVAMGLLGILAGAWVLLRRKKFVTG